MCRVERGRICSDMSQVVFDGRTEGRYGITAITDTDITLEYDKVTIGDDVYNYAINETQYEAMTDYNNMVLFNFIKDPSTAGTSTSQARYAKVGEIEIYDSANTLTYDYIPTVDENGIICFYERINDFYVYSSNGNNDYLSANTVNLGKGSFSANGTYSASTYGFDGYSEVTINVPQTGGSTNLGSKTGTTNGTYNASTDNLDGYSAFTINVDTASTYNSGYTSGYTDGQNNIIDTFSAMTATTNGQYGSSAHPLSAITVEVPQTGSSIPLSSITFTANTSVTVTDKASGYTSGFTDGTGALSAITFTANTAVTLNQGGYSAVTVNIDTATTWNDGYAAGQGELFCLYCENALFNIGESSSEAEFDDVYINLLTLSGFNITVGGGGRGGQLVATDSGNTVGFVGYWQTRGNTYTTPVTSIAKGTIPTGMVSVGITDYGPINFYVDGTSATSSGGVKIPTGSYSLSFSGDSFYLGSIRRNSYYNCFTPYVDDNGNACMIGPNRTLVYPTSGTCYAVYKKVTKNGEYVYYMNKEVGRVTQ